MARKKRAEIRKKVFIPFSVTLGLCAGVVAASIILLTYFVSGLLDNNFLLALFYASLFILFGYSGYSSQVTNKKNLYAGARGGLITACITVSIIFLAFFIYENIFIATVSQRPDIIWGFLQSGCSSMKEYINYSVLHASFFAVPVGAFFGSVLGMFGGVVAKV